MGGARLGAPVPTLRGSMLAMEPGDVADAMVLVDAVRGGVGDEVDIEVALADGPSRTVVATWQQRSASPRVVEAVRSPDRRSVAVLVGTELRQVDLRTGTCATVGTGVVPSDAYEVLLTWGDGGPRAVEPTGAARVELPTGDGRTLVATAPLEHDRGFSGGDHGSAAGFLMPLDAGLDEIEAARAEHDAWIADEARAGRHDRVVVDGRHAPVVLLDERTTQKQGRVNVHWPVSVGPSGVIVRRSTSRADGRGSEHTTIDEPWLVRCDGTVERIPVRLGNAPLCELPDGRWLMPGADELWCDAGDEPLHALGRDGALSPWCPDREVSTTSLLRAVAPELLPTDPDPEPDDWPWATAARVSADGRDVVLLITGARWGPIWDEEEPVAWAIVRLRSDGRGAPSLLGKGRRTGERCTAVVL